MLDDGFGDWRIAHVTTLAEDVPPAYPGGPSHKAGTPVYVSSLAEHSEYDYLGFVTPHATALALSVSLSSANHAAHLRSTLAVRDSITPFGKGKTIVNENLPHLYDFFEHSMVSGSFALLSLETFANWQISLQDDAEVEIVRNGSTVQLKGVEIERGSSISEKLSQILPKLIDVSSPKGRRPWEGFVILRRIRDSTIHMKSSDMFTRHRLDTDSLYYQFLNQDPRQYPRAALEMLSWFTREDEEPRWLRAFRERLESE